MEFSRLPREVRVTQVWKLKLKEGQTRWQAKGARGCSAVFSLFLPAPPHPRAGLREWVSLPHPCLSSTPAHSQGWTIPDDVVAVATERSAAAGWEALSPLNDAPRQGRHLGPCWGVGRGPSGQGLLADGGGALAGGKLLREAVVCHPRRAAGRLRRAPAVCH